MQTKKAFVTEEKLRLAISKILYEITDLKQDVQDYKPVIQTQNRVEMGKKFAYEKDAAPEVRLIAIGNKDSSKKIVKIYKPTAKDFNPVKSGNGKLIPEDEMLRLADDYDWSEEFFYQNPEAKKDIEEIVKLLDMVPSKASTKSSELYNKYQIFSPAVELQRPKYETTRGAIDKSKEFGCTLTLDQFKKEVISLIAAAPSPAPRDLFRVTTARGTPELGYQMVGMPDWMAAAGYLANLPGEIARSQPDLPDANRFVDRIVPCIKDYTTDSFMFGLMQGLLAMLGPAGIAAGMAADLVPGVIIVVYFAKRGYKSLALFYALLTLINMFTPQAVDAALLASRKLDAKLYAKLLQRAGAEGIEMAEDVIENPVVIFLINVGAAFLLVDISNKICEFFLGEPNMFSNKDVEDALKELADKYKNGSAKEFLEDAKQKKAKFEDLGILDPQGLGKKYPDTF